MSIPGKIVIAILAAVIVSLIASASDASLGFVPLFLSSAIAALLAVLASHRPLSMPAALASSPETSPSASARATKGATTGAGKAERGTVKWFNGTKGFGFIIRESGEEIFVHYRSILGEGRRSLRDGQAVSFRVAETDKGPQAEDVEALD
jgi:CspA family cold shock protein